MPNMPPVPADFSVPADLAPRFRPIDGSGARRGRYLPEELRAVAEHLAARGPRAVAGIPVARRLAVWNATLADFLEPGSRERSALLPRLLTSARLSAEGLTEALEVVLGGATGPPAAEMARRAGAFAATSVGHPEPSLAGVVLAANIPGLAVQSLLPAVLLGRPLLLKSAAAEPWFAPALIAALAAREPALADAYAAVHFPGEDESAFTAAFARAAPLLAYGGGPAIDSLAARFGDRLVAYGPKASIAIVGRDADPVGSARGLARDIALFDQRGCLSVQAVYTDGDPSALASALAWALKLESARLPAGPIDAETAAAVQQLRAVAALRRVEGGRPEIELDPREGTVLVEPELFFRPGPGMRTVRVHGVRTLREVLAALEAWRGKLQGAALAGPMAGELASDLLLLGFSRLAPAGELQSADASWANGGIDPLAVLAGA